MCVGGRSEQGLVSSENILLRSWEIKYSISGIGNIIRVGMIPIALLASIIHE